MKYAEINWPLFWRWRNQLVPHSKSAEVQWYKDLTLLYDRNKKVSAGMEAIRNRITQKTIANH